MSERKINCGLYIGDVLGWRSYRDNLKNFVNNEENLSAIWLDGCDEKTHAIKLISNNIFSGYFGRLSDALVARHNAKKSNCDFILTEGAGVNIFSNLDSRLFAVIDATPVQLQGFGDLYGHKKSYKFFENIKHRVRKNSYESCEHIFAASNWVKNSLVEDYGVEPDRCSVFPLGVIIDRFSHILPKKSSDSSEIKILFIGGDFKRKGGDMLMRWCREFMPKHVHVTFVTRSILGELPPRCSAITNINASDQGFPDFISEFDLFCLPTLGDCSSIALMEAAASGIPALASAVGGVGELINNGETGYTLKPNSYSDLCEKLDYLVSRKDVVFRMGLSAKEKAILDFSFEKNIRKIFATINSQN